MPRLKHSIPAYRHHLASGQAIVTLNGREYYLGPHGSKVSRAEYDRLVGEWLQQGRRQAPPKDNLDECELTVVELIAAYLPFTRTYYRKHGRPTSEAKAIIYALRYVNRFYGHKPVREFGPVALQTVMDAMVKDDLSRGVINQNAGRIRRMFKWGVSRELISPGVHQALTCVRGLLRERTDARNFTVRPVDDPIVEATIDHLPEVVADMVRLERLTGMPAPG